MVTRRNFVIGGALVALGAYKLLWSRLPLYDNPNIKDSDLYVVQEWRGKSTAGNARDNFNSEIKVYFGSGNASIKTDWLTGKPTGTDYTVSGAPIGEIKVEDHGIGESMTARNDKGEIIASYSEKVERSWGGYFGMKGSLVGYLNDTKTPVVIMPEDIAVISKTGSVKLGIYDIDGKAVPIGEIETKKSLSGILGNQRAGTVMYKLVIKGDEVVGLEKIIETDDGWQDWLGLPTSGDVYDKDKKLLYNIETYWFNDFNLRSWFDILKIKTPDGRDVAMIEVDDPDSVDQLGYIIYADADGKGLKKLGNFIFHSEEKEIGKDTGNYHWVGELWAKLEGATSEEKMKNLELADKVLKLMPDQVMIDQDSALYNIEEYSDYARLLLNPTPAALANTVTSGDIIDLKLALDTLVYRK